MSLSSAEAAATGESLSALEALHSTPSRRYLAPDPIPEEVLWAILDAAIRGPSGGNSQAWGWVVVTDEEVKRHVAAWYRENWENAYGQHRDRLLAGGSGSSGLPPRGFLGAEYLANHLEEAPVWVFPVLRNAANVTSPRVGSSIYGAVQQLCLAARAYGIGTSLTTLYGGHEEELRELLGLPEDALTMALIPMGYPARGWWAEPKRRPVGEVVHWNRWGATRTKPLFRADERVRDLAEEDLGGLGPNALELLQPRGDLRAGPGGAHQARDRATVVSRQAAHHGPQLLAHDRAQPVVVPLPQLMPERVLVVRGEVLGRVPAIRLELAVGGGGRLLLNRAPEQQAGQQPVEQALVSVGVNAQIGGSDQRSHGSVPSILSDRFESSRRGRRWRAPVGSWRAMKADWPRPTRHASSRPPVKRTEPDAEDRKPPPSNGNLLPPPVRML